MSRLDSFLERSLIAETLGQVESGAEVDFPRLQARQALTMVRIGELFALDALEAERLEDDRFRDFIERV